MKKSWLAPTLLLFTLQWAYAGPVDTARASAGMGVLENWYHWSACEWYEPWTWSALCQAGTWQPSALWWTSASSLTVTIDYSALSGDKTWISLIENAFANRNTSDYMDTDYNDDEAWWALAWIDAYDLQKNPAYLVRAQYIFNDMALFWDDTCGGGIWWQKYPNFYKNAIANELFLSVAAKLYNRTRNPAYLGWAQAEFRWLFQTSTLFTPGQRIPDGLDTSTCHVPAGTEATAWTFDQGVIIGALVEFGMTELAKNIANTALQSSLVKNGVLTEWNEFTSSGCDIGCSQFKGVFMRNLGALYRSLPSSDPDKAAYAAFIRQNAEAIWKNNLQGSQSAPNFGLHWNGPAGNAVNATSQTAALDALVAAIPL